MGLPKKKKRETEKLKSFLKMPIGKKRGVILSMILGDGVNLQATEIIESAFKIEFDQMPQKASSISNGILHREVNIDLVRELFTKESWELLLILIKKKKDRNCQTFCEECKDECTQNDMIECCHCLIKYHLDCASVKKKPKAKNWFCKQCKTGEVFLKFKGFFFTFFVY